VYNTVKFGNNVPIFFYGILLPQSSKLIYLAIIITETHIETIFLSERACIMLSTKMINAFSSENKA